MESSCRHRIRLCFCPNKQNDRTTVVVRPSRASSLSASLTSLCCICSTCSCLCNALCNAAASSLWRCSNWANLLCCLCSLVSLGIPVALELGPTANPLFANHASKTHPTTSRVPACTTLLLIGSLPLTPMFTMHWNAKENRYAACLSNDCGFNAGLSLGCREEGGVSP
jgi:hypothetical protein